MPNLVTHYLCGLEAIEALENQECKKLVQKHQNVFNLGTQGPDILFYYEIWPWSSKSIETNIGQTMHISKVNKVFGAFIDYIAGQSGYARDVLTVYLLGFICHNCMDSIGHPYIFYRSGFNIPEYINENLFLCYHRRFETSIDVLLCKKHLNKRVHEINCDRLIQVNETELNLIGEMYASAVKKVFDSDIQKKKVRRAVREMQLVEKLLKDPHGIKKKLIGFFDKLIYRFPLYSSLIFPLEVKDGLDYLNLSHREWCMPFDNTIKSTKSFIDLFSDAVRRTQQLSNDLYNAIFNNNSNIHHVLELLGNNSYTTGVDCDMQAAFKYSDIIFD